MTATATSTRLFTPATGLGPGSAELRASDVGPEIWQEGIVLEAVAGRGSVRRVGWSGGQAVLRHYRRGGFLARLLGDLYWFSGDDRTRCFREFRLLEKLQRKGLPAPRPLAARFVRSGLWYRADLAMAELPDVQSLHVALGATDRAADSSRLGTLAALVGCAIGRFHRAGVWHADLNAHNVLLDARQQVWLVDFDRGEFRVPRRTWQQSNLYRLRRSLKRLRHDQQPGFEQAFWQPLLAAHAEVLQGGATS